MKIGGKCSWFGGPPDLEAGGISADEPLAFIYDVSDAPYLFLPGTEEALAQYLNPAMPYVACRWTYEDEQTRENLLRYAAAVYCPRTQRGFLAAPADWGPHPDAGRVADLSPGIFDLLGLMTDDIVDVTFPIIYERKPNEEGAARVVRNIPRLRGFRGSGETKKRPHL